MMTNASLIVITVNSVLLAIALVLTVVMLRAGARHDYHYGESDIQEPLKRLIMRIVLVLIGLSFVAAVFNLLYSQFLG